MPPRKYTNDVEFLKELFKLPVPEWKASLTDHRELLDDRFFENVEKRIRWDLDNDHWDDALRFALLGDIAGTVQGRATNYKESLSRLVVSISRASKPRQVSGGWGVWGWGDQITIDAQKIEEMALWSSWPSSTPLQKRQRDLLRETLSRPVSEWPDALGEGELLDDEFFAQVAESVSEALFKGEEERAVCFALLGDHAARLKKRNLHFGLRVTNALGEAPEFRDERDGTTILFPGAHYRPANTIVPSIGGETFHDPDPIWSYPARRRNLGDFRGFESRESP